MTKANTKANEAVVKTGEVAVQSTTAPTKADKARVVFDRCYAMNPVPARKDIIKMAMDEAGLTKPGAATYLQNYKGKKGLSVKRTPVAA